MPAATVALAACGARTKAASAAFRFLGRLRAGRHCRSMPISLKLR